MTRLLVAAVVGEGIASAHHDGAHGTVIGTFRHGCYVQVGGGLYAIAGPAVAPGPIHLILTEDPGHVPEGLAVWRDGELLRSTGWTIDLAGVPVYAPHRPTPGELVRARPAFSTLAEVLPVPVDLQQIWGQLRASVGDRGLDAARQLLEGRGGGLTPTGDDVLAGLLLVRAWSGSDPGELVAVAREAATTNLSRTFLHWAAKGQSLAPVHQLVRDAAAGDLVAFKAGAALVSAVGATSGTALLWGLRLGVLATTGVRPAAEGADLTL